jgi:hypothetical protein
MAHRDTCVGKRVVAGYKTYYVVASWQAEGRLRSRGEARLAVVEMKAKAVCGQAGRSSFAYIDHRRTSSITRRWCVSSQGPGHWGEGTVSENDWAGLCKTCIRPAGGLWRCGGGAAEQGTWAGVFGVKEREFSPFLRRLAPTYHRTRPRPPSAPTSGHNCRRCV